MRKARICIIAHYAYGALRGGEHGHIGGAERQTSLMAQWFAAAGHETSLITWDEGQADGSKVAGVTVWKTCRADAGLPVARFFHPRLTGLYSAMRRANAEVYYHNAAEAVTGLAASWCRRHGRKFVYSAAAELACDARLPLLSKFQERKFYAYGLRAADLRIVQTRAQQKLLQDGWNLPSVVLPMPCPDSASPNAIPAEPPSAGRVIWVGRVDTNKRLNWLLDVAEKLPSVTFEIAAADNGALDLTNNLRARATTLTNVRWRGAVPRELMPEFYRGATCLCCTSMHEGFPNIFIEAWSHGVPVVTTFDPDGTVVRSGIGVAASGVNELVGAISDFCSNRALWCETSRRAREYYRANHRVDAVMPRFQAELNCLVVGQNNPRQNVELSGAGLSSHSQARS